MKHRNNNGTTRNDSNLLIRSLCASAVTAVLAMPVVNAKSIDTDFDGDGRDDFVVGDELADTPESIASGHVAIIQPDQNGEMRADIWSRHRLPNSGNTQTYSSFGRAVAVGDFNGDGHLDMAVGATYATAPFAPTPGMLGRAALGSCLAIGYMLWASRLDVPVTNLEVEIQADSDDAGLFGVTDVTPGYSQVRYCITIESTAIEETILAMLDEAEQHSPWLDVYTRPIDCQRHVRIVASEGF